MTARDLPRWRTYAAWVSGPLAVVLGVSAHLLSGAAVPGPLVLVAIAALLSMAASMLAGLRIRVWVLFLASGLVQQVLHLLFTGFVDASGDTPPGHTHGMFAWPLPQPQPAQTSGHHAIELMLHAHAGAALLTVLFLTQSKALVSRLRRKRTRPSGNR
ncbi:hypothetical protein [Arthrobacter sp. NPDC093139]|uniref:hypothetical protein n=1 Tax=Arthrobacter sp. NPDC093139 TaxID=3363945 RepID=UPI0038020236